MINRLKLSRCLFWTRERSGPPCVLPHPGPLPLGAGESKSGLHKYPRRDSRDTVSKITRQHNLFPLPAGEGQGEGEALGFLSMRYLFRPASSLVVACLLLASTLATRAAQVIETDICIYGGTSGGVSAAVAAARLGKSVALVSLNNHLGGMTASGLGVTDISLSPPNEAS